MKKRGITLIALVVTIVILLILAGVSIAIIIGPDGMLDKARETKIDSRYSSVMDKVYVRDGEIEVFNAVGGEAFVEDSNTFISRLLAEKIIEEGNALGQDKIDKNKIYIGKQNDTDYKYVITVRELDLGDMILRIRTTTSNEEVTLPINKTGGLTIDWGETTGSEYADPNKYSFPTFTYPTAGNYKVKIKGEVEKDTVFGSYGLYVNKNLVGIEKWGENGFYVITTLGQNIGGIIPTPTTRSFRNVTSFERTFYGCTDLIGNIPKTLFKYSPNATTFYYTFYGCTGLSGNIPGDLVDNCPNAQVFTSMFANCSGLTGDAPKLWNISIATNFSNCFTGCTNLTNRNQIPQSWGGDKP